MSADTWTTGSTDDPSRASWDNNAWDTPTLETPAVRLRRAQQQATSAPAHVSAQPSAQPAPVARRLAAQRARQAMYARQQQRRYGARGQQIAVLGVLLMLALIVGRLVSDLNAGLLFPVAHAASPAPLLPGETLWNGVPSYMFGLGDTYNYLNTGFRGESSIQAQVRSAHVPLIREFFERVDETDHTTPIPDATQLAIAHDIVNSGAQCMANLTQDTDLSTSADVSAAVTWDLHMVALLSPYCRYFEVMNEPDLGTGNWPPAVTEPNYLAFWNTFVPQARAQTPGVSFGGPALASEFGLDDPNYMQHWLSGAAASGVAPDFVTYHWYMCSGQASSSCLGDVDQWAPGHGKTVSGWLASDFPGKAIPLGITEWSADPGNPPWGYDDAFMSQFEQHALAGLEQNPYLSFATQFDIAAYAGYGTLDLFRTSYPEAGSLDYSNTPQAIGSPRPMFGVLASEIAKMSVGTVAPPPPSPTPTQQPPSPTPTSSGVPAYAHVITIMEENHSYGDIIGSSSAPYINGTLLRAGALATNYTANVQSSLPNYMALTGGTTLGWTSNCEPDNCSSSGASIMAEATASGQSWKMYEENMTSPCQNVVDGGTGGLYTVHHNPAPFYTAIAAACQTRDVNFSQLATDLQAPSSLPSYVFITPNLNDDMHNGTVSAGDTWLAQQIPAIQQSPACTQSRCLIAVTWDEGSYDASGNPLSPHVATILLGPDVVAGARDATAYTHYNLLRTEEEALGLPTMTANDAGAAPMLGMFNATSGSPSPTPTPIPPTPVPPSPTPTQQPPAPTPSPSGGGSTLFSDTFEADGLGDAPAGWTISSGAWMIEQDGSHVLRQITAPAASSYVSAGSPSWTDYTLTASVKMPSGSGLYGTYNLMGRYHDANNHYSLILKNGSEWWLGVKRNGNWSTLAVGSFPYQANVWYTFALSFSGSHITASINGKALATATDSTFAAGAIGFNTDASGELDNVSVVAPGGTPPPPPPPPTPTPVPPTPTPSPQPINNAPCTVTLPTGTQSGTCSGIFTPAS